ncbi:MAG: T9SS type A sorting domain-containing protein [Bacteroidales bacterium]
MRKFVLLLISTLVFGQMAGQVLKPPEIRPPSNEANSIHATPARSAPALKGGGEIFWTEEFDWADPSIPIGWRLPEGWTLEDPGDIGYNWHWANDTLKGVYTNEPPLNSTSKANGFLALNLDGYNKDLGDYTNYLPVNNSIVSPKIDCSAHSSVLVNIQQNFRYWSEAVMLFEVTNDDGLHWAAFDMEMGTLISERVGGIPAGGKVDLRLNISDVAAGSSQVQFRITWRDARLYYWMIDDISFMEGWDNDIQMLYYQADYDNGNEEDEGFFYMVPKTQISGYDMMAVIRNFGNLDQWRTQLQVTVTKNNQIIYDQGTTPYTLFPGITDTFRIPNQFVPEEFGHYQMDFYAKMDAEDELPHDNHASIPFHITDSVFSRCDDRPEVTFSTWGWYTYQHEGDLMGTWYTMKTDAEISSIAVYISSADIRSSFRLLLLEYSAVDDALFTLVSSDLVDMDSTILKNHWVTLPIQQDGESEFLKAGSSYLACIEFWNNLDFEEAYDSRRYAIGSDRSNYYPSGQCWFWQSEIDAWWSSGSDLFMIRMHLNDDSNIVDGILAEPNGTISLLQNYPNPFSDHTVMTYELPSRSDVVLDIRDITGRSVWRREMSDQDAGKHTVQLEGSQLAPGTYFLTLSTAGFKKTIRMSVVR